MKTKRELEQLPTPRISFLGLSRDQRTNRWMFYCVCGYSFEPGTTLSSIQGVQCGKCYREYTVNYNTEEIKAYS